MSLEQMWALVQPWYGGRLDSTWRGRTTDEARSILKRVGLTGPFWDLG
ncbi:MAG: hypothetical protein ACPHQP_02235 [Longimicrobiales bacterium]